MASGISPKLPLIPDDVDGPYGLNKTLTESIKQNFRNLMLTIPGERIMIPDFGVGLPRYLFENQNNLNSLLPQIQNRIINQTKKHMPFIEIRSVQLNPGDQTNSTSLNSMSLEIKYFITPLNEEDSLEVGVDLSGEVVL